ncbi:TPA: ead/Ea22-like family protein [Citrobacter braakii]|nr:ead/Ea22-like family protein [Citrobacter braakii]
MTALKALRQLAEKAGGEEWQSRKEPGVGSEYTVIVKGSLKKNQGWSTCRPVADQVVNKKTMDFISAANPAAVLALLDDLEAAENNLIDSECHVAELEESLRDKQALLETAERRIAELEARVLPEECPIELSDQIVDICDGIIVGDVAAQMIWDSFRAAMLQDAGIGVKGE